MKRTTAVTKYGSYIGKENAQGVIEFKGIPYAKTPERWKSAESPEISDETFFAYDFAPMCVQPYRTVECEPWMPQTEDCLHLNICTYDMDVKGKPVMVFIHGGCYTTGDPATPGYYGEQLVADNKDIVFVNFSYRLGIFGSLDLHSIDPQNQYGESINLTTKDQILALKWIKENIEEFGGDSDNITLFGQSAGSYTISVLMTIPEAVGLFNKGICESGVLDDNSINSLERADEIGRWFIQKIGIKDVSDLKDLDIDTLREMDTQIFRTFPLAYSPVRDGKLIPFDTYGAFKAGVGRNIKLMMGNTEGDGERLISDNPEDHRKRAVQTVHPAVLNEVTLEKYIENYPERDRLTAYKEAVTDVRYRLPLTMLAEEHIKYNDVYIYLWKWCAEEFPTRAPHMVELPFVMNKLTQPLYLEVDFGTVQGSNPPQKLQKEAQAAWTNFARYGTPNGEGIPIYWPKYDLESRATMVIDEEWHVSNDLRKKDRELFMPLYPERQ